MPAIGAVFRKGREWVAWMGLVRHEHSTVGKLSLLDISQRGELVSATTVRTRRRRSLQYREKQSSVLPSHGSPASLAGNSLPSEWGRSGGAFLPDRGVHQLQLLCLRFLRDNNVPHRQFTHDLLDEEVDRLTQGKVVGWFHKVRFESSARSQIAAFSLIPGTHR